MFNYLCTLKLYAPFRFQQVVTTAMINVIFICCSCCFCFVAAMLKNENRFISDTNRFFSYKVLDAFNYSFISCI